MSALTEAAYAKVNLCLFLGGTRADGRHELVTLFESVSLQDDLVISEAPGGADEVLCPGVEGPNLVDRALAGLRAEGWDAPPVRVEITKRIPVAAGLGGGSADAAALLRCAPRLATVSPERVRALAASLGADVPSQLRPAPAIGTGAGEIVTAVGELSAHALLLLPQEAALSTPDVYAEADRLGLARAPEELAALRSELEAALGGGSGTEGVATLPENLVRNDLQPASLSLCPGIGAALAGALEGGADQAIVCGSGPTVIGLFWGDRGIDRARASAQKLRGRFPLATAVFPTSLPSGTIEGEP
jgi:4-diphosphocytidyl-2-C-methyl-D-erythritol kinase